jgi:hypothetical protein
MKRTPMSRTIEAVIAQTKRQAISQAGKRLTAIWQNGVESAGHVQRKLRLTSMNVSASSRQLKGRICMLDILILKAITKL